MAPSLLIKPASGSCNMACPYCFYADEMKHRNTPLRGVMSRDTMEAVISKALSGSAGECSFSFQGGEPTLAGLAFFRSFIGEVERLRAKRKVKYAIQTNGLLLDGEWAAFFRENGFLVGLSLDGPQDIHDANRRDRAAQGSFTRVMRAADILRRNEVDMNVLAVVSSASAGKAGRIYSFFMEEGFVYQQYIHCLPPLFMPREADRHCLPAAERAAFMKSLFDLWLADRSKGIFVYIRDFENIAGALRGLPPENCGMCGQCVNQLVVEADGSVYPCDFYALDSYCLGSFREDTLDAICTHKHLHAFLAEAQDGKEACAGCCWYPLCRGGCRRDRQGLELRQIVSNTGCAALKSFYAYAIPKMLRLLANASRPSQGKRLMH